MAHGQGRNSTYSDTHKPHSDTPSKQINATENKSNQKERIRQIEKQAQAWRGLQGKVLTILLLPLTISLFSLTISL